MSEHEKVLEERVKSTIKRRIQKGLPLFTICRTLVVYQGIDSICDALHEWHKGTRQEIKDAIVESVWFECGRGTEHMQEHDAFYQLIVQLANPAFSSSIGCGDSLVFEVWYETANEFLQQLDDECKNYMVERLVKCIGLKISGLRGLGDRMIKGYKAPS